MSEEPRIQQVHELEQRLTAELTMAAPAAGVGAAPASGGLLASVRSEAARPARGRLTNLDG